MATRFLTEAELRGIYSEAVIDRLADRVVDGVVDEDVVEEAILYAEDRGLAKLLGRFEPSIIPTTPETTSRMLKEAFAGLAYYRLHKHYDSYPAKAIAERDEAEQTFSEIQAGQLSAVLDDNPAADSSRPLVSSIRRSTLLHEQPLTLLLMNDWGHRT